MPRIIKPATELICVCGSCKAEIGYFPFEVKEGTSKDISGVVDLYKFIICPSCDQKIILK